MNDVKVSMKDMLPLIRESIKVNGSVKIMVTGWSMQPMIYHNRDFVTLINPPERLKKYDIPLYVRDDGSVILHRIVNVADDGTYTCCGDNQFIKENGIRQDQIVGILSSFTRNGKNIDVKSFSYKVYAYTWPFFHHFKFLYKYFAKIRVCLL